MARLGISRGGTSERAAYLNISFTLKVTQRSHLCSEATFFVIVWVFAAQNGQVTTERTEFFWKQFSTEQECQTRADEAANTVRTNGDGW